MSIQGRRHKRLPRWQISCEQTRFSHTRFEKREKKKKKRDLMDYMGACIIYLPVYTTPVFVFSWLMMTNVSRQRKEESYDTRRKARDFREYNRGHVHTPYICKNSLLQ